MDKLNSFSGVTPKAIAEASQKYGTPFYLYDERLLIEKCRMALSMPNAYGINVRYAIKANSNKTLLRIINKQGLYFDASSLNEVKRSVMAGIGLNRIMLTTQESQAQESQERIELERMMKDGLKYNVCSLRQLYLIEDFAKKHKIDLSIRIHPGIGSGESASRNTGDKYSCFGIYLGDVEAALRYVDDKGIRFTQVHVHIGSGGDPVVWKKNIDLELGFIEKYFPHAEIVSFGGGLKEARMPGETAADIYALGLYAKQQIEKFHDRTKRQLIMEIEPGTFIVANSGYVIAQVIDKKQTGADGFNFIIVDGGMEVNARPVMYGSQHPFYIISRDGRLLSSEFNEESPNSLKSLEPFNSFSKKIVIVGRCCESGDSQCLDSQANIMPRRMADPNVGDIVAIGGAGAYCSTMAPFNYNSHTQVPEVLFTQNGQLKLIRRRQTLKQIIANEI